MRPESTNDTPGTPTYSITGDRIALGPIEHDASAAVLPLVQRFRVAADGWYRRRSMDDGTR